MVLRLLEEHWPLDEVVFYNTGMEFQAVYSVRDAVVPQIREAGVTFTELTPERPFLYDMLARPIEKRNGDFTYGYGWCGGSCRWGTATKRQILNRHQKDANVYLGIAIDEPERLARLKECQSSPLAQWNMTEADCLQYCYDHGIRWMEGDVNLYDVLDRVSCWCCSNKNKRELENMYRYLPDYWKKLKALQVRISERPMKRYQNRIRGEYGNVIEMEKDFSEEE